MATIVSRPEGIEVRPPRKPGDFYQLQIQLKIGKEVFLLTPEEARDLFHQLLSAMVAMEQPA